MDWSKVAGAVAKAAPILGTALGGPLGGVAGALVASLFGVEAEPGQVEAAIAADPEAAIKLRRLEQEHARQLTRMTLEAETARLAEVNRTMRAEYGSSDAFVRRWRPLFGYMIALTWGLQTCAIAFAMVVEPEYAAGIVNAVVALTPMWGVALSVLGINIVKRSQDKAVAAGVGQPSGLIGALAQRLTTRS